MECLIHFNDKEVDQQLTAMTESSFCKILSSANRWKDTDSAAEKGIAIRCLEIIQGRPLIVVSDAYGYHRRCYACFTNTTLIKRAEVKLKEVVRDSGHLSVTEVQDLPSKRLKRSTSTQSRSAHVLPVKCIICQKEKSREKIAGKWIHSKLSVAETIDGGKLRAAAEFKQDETILLQIQGKDCVAIEVRYHRSCYQNYTRCIREKQQPQGHIEQYVTAFDAFCKEVLEPNILSGSQVVSLSSLLRKFIKIAGETEGLDASNYK